MIALTEIEYVREKESAFHTIFFKSSHFSLFVKSLHLVFNEIHSLLFSPSHNYNKKKKKIQHQFNQFTKGRVKGEKNVCTHI
jgi:hypothetical protein